MSRPPPARSKFDFGFHDNSNSNNWALDVERDWHARPEVHEKGWNQEAEYEDVTPDRFSSKKQQLFV